MSLVEDSAEEIGRNERGRITPGMRLNPHGRPKGNRNKLGEAFIADLNEAWLQYGMDAIVRTIKNKPDQFLRVIAGLMPKDVNISVRQLDDLTDEQLILRLRQVTEQARPLLIDVTPLAPQRHPEPDVVDVISNDINDIAHT